MIVRFVIIRIGRDRGVVALERVSVPPEMQQDIAAKQMKRPVVGIGCDTLRGRGERIVEALLLHQNVADVQERGGEIGLQRDRALVALQCRIVLLQALQHLAARVPQIGVARFDRQRFVDHLQRLVETLVVHQHDHAVRHRGDMIGRDPQHGVDVLSRLVMAVHLKEHIGAVMQREHRLRRDREHALEVLEGVLGPSVLRQREPAIDQCVLVLRLQPDGPGEHVDRLGVPLKLQQHVSVRGEDFRGLRA